MPFAESDIAKDILERRYYAPGEESPEDLLRRVADYIASAEIEEDRKYYADQFYRIMRHGLFLPNSPCLVNAGRGGGLFACFVLGMEDSLDSISQAKADAMAITKFGGGWGVPLGNLRPQGSKVMGSTHGIAGGPVRFWETFSYDMRTMTQGGFRDAACMATMPVNHPDIEYFINAKSPVNSVVRLLNLDAITSEEEARDTAERLLDNSTIATAAETYMANFNVSVLVSDDFMNTAMRNSDEAYMPTYHPAYGDSPGAPIYPKKVLRDIAQGMWENGEPGILFIDTIRERTRYEPEAINATNPCGEQALPPNGSCCLGSINLSQFVIGATASDGRPQTIGELIDIPRLRETVKIAVRFLDNMITMNEFPTKETELWSHKNRAIGLGIMGWADALVKMGIRYDSAQAVDIGELLAGAIRVYAEEESKILLKEKGGEDWDGRRNRAVLSIAPTGTISLLAGTSAGIEPIFRAEFVREDKVGTHVIKHPLADEDAFVTVADIDPEWIIQHVSAWSKEIDNSVSYTVNVPHDATIDDIENLIFEAWDLGCNGITVYRNGSRVRQVLNSVGENLTKKVRPHVLGGQTYKYSAQLGNEKTNVYVTVNSDNGDPWEIFAHTPNIRSMPELQLVTTATRLSSLCLRSGVPVEDVVDQLRKVEGQSFASVPAILASALSEYINLSEVCPECGGEVVFQGGCNSCVNCGYSSCG